VTRWLSWEVTDRAALTELTLGLKIGENQLRDLMDWLEEVAARDRTKIYQILGDPSIVDVMTDPRLGRADKVKRIKDRLRRLRFPRLAQTEDAIREKIQALKLHPGIKLSVPPGLEGGRLQAGLSAARQQEFKNLSAKLSEAVEKSTVAEIFNLLSGRQSEPERT